MEAKRCSVVYLLVLVNGEDIEDHPVASLLGRADRILEYYLGRPNNLPGRDVAGGFRVYADGEIVMDQIDEIGMSQTYWPAILSLLHGEVETGVWAWEESNLTLTRVGPYVEMEDVRQPGMVICPRTRFDFLDFVRAFIEASRPMTQFVEEFHAAIRREYDVITRVPDEVKKDKLDYLAEEVSPDWSKWIDEAEELLRGQDQ